MIRINLLPQSKKQARAPAASGSSQIWAAVYLGTGLLWMACLAVVYFMYDGTLEEQQQKNAELSTRIDALRLESAQLDEVKTKIAQSKELEEVVAGLEKARLGPTRALMEMSQILSPNGGPTIDPQALEQLRRDNPLAGFNRSWDPRRLWITGFEEQNRNCKIKGLGRSNEDVAEFLRRLALSELFEKVTLTKTQAQTERGTQLRFINFELTCSVRY